LGAGIKAEGRVAPKVKRRTEGRSGDFKRVRTVLKLKSGGGFNPRETSRNQHPTDRFRNH